MATYLDRLIDYDTWANQGLLDFLRAQPPETLDLTAGGVYGTIRETLEHLFSSEMGYSRRLTPPPASARMCATQDAQKQPAVLAIA